MSRDSFLEKVLRGELSLTTQKPEHNDTVYLFFLIDVSRSMLEACGRTTKLGAVQRAILRLIDQLVQRGMNVYVAIVAFNHEAYLKLPMTCFRDHPDRVQKTILRLYAGGGTDLSAPLWLLLRNQQIQESRRTRIIMLSDGHGSDPRTPGKQIKSSGTIIETIGVANTREEVAEDHLRMTASVQDGKVLYRFVRDADVLADYFQTEIADRLVKRS